VTEDMEQGVEGIHRRLAQGLDRHLGRHPQRDQDCVVCTVVLATVLSWGQREFDDPLAPIQPGDERDRVVAYDTDGTPRLMAKEAEGEQ